MKSSMINSELWPRLAGCLVACAALLSIAPASLKAVPTDFDGDGKSEIVLVDLPKKDTDSVVWKVFYPVTGQVTPLGSLGTKKDYRILADWLKAGQPQIGVAHLDEESGGLTWSIKGSDGALIRRSFGTKGDLLVAGADFDNNGYADAALVKIDKKLVKWTIAFDLFAPSGGSRQNVYFGKNGDRAFFANPFGSGDWMGVVRKGRRNSSVIVLKNPLSGEERTLNGIGAFASRNPRPRPLPVALGDGTEYLAFAVSGKETTKVYRQYLDGSPASTFTLPGTGELIVGNFTDSPGDEVGIKSDTGFVTLNSAVSLMTSFDIPGGTPVDDININTAGGESTPGGGTAGPNPGGSLGAVCTSVSVLAGNILYKFQASGHLASTDRSNSCSFIYGPGNNGYPRQNTLPLYDGQGNLLANFIAYELGGCPYPARWYTSGGGPSCSQIANTAAQRTGNYSGYIGIGGGVCLKVNDLRSRQGSPNSAGSGAQCH
jgi:hypothetical protein